MLSDSNDAKRVNASVYCHAESCTVYSVSQKNTPLRFSDIFSQTVGNF